MSKTGTIRGAAPARCIAAGIAMLLALACACLTGSAFNPQTAYAADQDASLTVVVKHEEKGAVHNISGVEFTAYRVACLNDGNAYELVEPFTGANVDFNNNMTAAQSIAAAKSMASTAASKKPAGKKATTDTRGNANFGALDMGVYLVVQTGAQGMAQKYTTMPAFLINVPQFEDGKATFDVVAQAKPELKPVQPAPKKPSPKTGDSLDWNFIWLAAAIGFLAMMMALMAARKRRNE